MEIDEPLPLIERPGHFYMGEYSADLESVEVQNRLKFYGYVLIISTWIIFFISVNSLFKLWTYVIHPLSLNAETLQLYGKLRTVFETLDTYVISCWCIYVVVWWWSFASWCGMKLFRHSKGIQNDD